MINDVGGIHRIPKTKADALRWLKPLLHASRILDQVCVEVSQWKSNPGDCLQRIQRAFPGRTLVVRSSALNESNETSSNSGAHLSVLGVNGDDADALNKAIQAVIESYGEDVPGNQVLVQPQLSNVVFSAVISTVDRETGAPYYTCTYSEVAGRTDDITSGSGRSLQQYVRWHDCTKAYPSEWLAKAVKSVQEIEAISGQGLEVELSIDSLGDTYVFQARPVIDCSQGEGASAEQLRENLNAVSSALEAGSRIKVHGVMPDWNPAELIGIKPAPLAFSFYRHLFADSIWAEARRDLGYHDLTGTPLVRSFCGCPFVDVESSFLSLTPAGLHESIRRRLVDFQLTVLRQHPHLHDKVEFEIVISCFSPGFHRKSRKLTENGFSHEDVSQLQSALKRLTCQLLDRNAVYADVRQSEALKSLVVAANSPLVDRIRTVLAGLDACRREGALPFARLARQAFISVQCLREFVTEGRIQPTEFDTFFAGLRTVASGLNESLAAVQSGASSRESFISTYGHLRPGTYDLTSPRYDEAFDSYFSPLLKGQAGVAIQAVEAPVFRLSPTSREAVARYLGELGSPLSVEELFRFFRAAIEAREKAKLEFTRLLSDALSQVRILAEHCGENPDQGRFLTREDLIEATHRPENPATILLDAIKKNREQHRITRSVKFPDLITRPEDTEHFVSYLQSPNFVTRNRVTGPVIREAGMANSPLRGAVVCVRAADPGHDWIFAHQIGGLVTRFGGTNSHMAVRCAELGLPAVIGCGEADFRKWSSARILAIDCGVQTVSVVA